MKIDQARTLLLKMDKMALQNRQTENPRIYGTNNQMLLHQKVLPSFYETDYRKLQPEIITKEKPENGLALYEPKEEGCQEDN